MKEGVVYPLYLGRMRSILIVAFLGVFPLQVFAQITDQERFIERERQRKLEEIRRIEAQRDKYEKDPKRFMDSLRMVASLEQREEAKRRLTRYEENKRVDTLSSIDLSHSGLEKIPDFVFEARSLKKLVLSHNLIEKLPRKLRRNNKLEVIHWDNNQLEKARYARLTSVRKLILKENNLVKLTSLRKLPNVDILDLSKNQFAQIDIRKISASQSLSELILSDNPVELYEGKYAKLSSLTILKMNRCGLDKIHPSFYKIPQLNELQLQENNLSGLPEGISELNRLSKLSLYKNKLNTLPSDFFQIQNLAVLDLYYNQLEVLPRTIKQAKKMEILYASHNKLYDIPEELGGLQSLRQLYLHHNRISAMPSGLSGLNKLEVLRINDNYLVDFPNQIIGLRYLRELDIDNNEVTEIPLEISSLEKLALFTYNGNPINIESPENGELAQVLFEMGEKGVICKPAVDHRMILEE